MSEPTVAPEVRSVGAETIFRFQASVGGHTSRFDALVDLKEILTETEFAKVQKAAIERISESIHDWGAAVASQPVDPGVVVPLPPPPPPPTDPLLAAEGEAPDGNDDEGKRSVPRRRGK